MFQGLVQVFQALVQVFQALEHKNSLRENYFLPRCKLKFIEKKYIFSWYFAHLILLLQTNMTLFSKRYPLSCILCVAIWVVCLIPIPDIEPLHGFNLIDKWTHFVMYGGFSFVWCYERRSLSWHTVVLPIVMGGMIELAQNYLTTCRSGEWADLLANSIGVVLGNVAYFALEKIKK
jgi:VanZ family protein